MHCVWKEFIIKINKMTNKNRCAGSKMTLQVLFCVVADNNISPGWKSPLHNNKNAKESSSNKT